MVVCDGVGGGLPMDLGGTASWAGKIGGVQTGNSTQGGYSPKVCKGQGLTVRWLTNSK